MFPTPKPVLEPNTYAYESEPMVKPTGFREYDARWLFQKEINLMGIQALGMGLGTLMHEMGIKPEIVTGHDFRSYSSSIKIALTSGLMAAGIKVHDMARPMSPVPPITYASIASILTGTEPEVHGVPGNRWFDPAERLFRNYATIKYYRAVNDDFTVPTLYERIAPRHSSSLTRLTSLP